MPSTTSGEELTARGGVRLTPEERRRQLVGIGLRKFVERPVQELSLDEVASEAGVSRGLLFHYFPSKTAYHRAVVEAAGRRVMRNVRPDEGVVGPTGIAQIVERFVEQVDRRRAFYLALVFGQLPGSGPTEDGEGAVAATLRSAFTDLVIEVGGLDPARRAIVHGWVAYVEDRALGATDGLVPADRGPLVDHCVSALARLLSV